MDIISSFPWNTHGAQTMAISCGQNDMKIPWKPMESDLENSMASPWYYHECNLQFSMEYPW